MNEMKTVDEKTTATELEELFDTTRQLDELADGAVGMLTVIEAEVFSDEPFHDVLRVELALSCPRCCDESFLIVTDIMANGSRILECDECGTSYCIQSSDSEVGDEFTVGFNTWKELE